MKNNLIFNASDGEKIRTTTYLNENIFNGNSVIFVHGFKGFKDWGFFPYIAEYFANLGYFSILFNFSYNGTGDNLTEFSELEKFSKNTFSREVRELSELISALKDNFFNVGAQGKLGLVGHSRGGAISLFCGAKLKAVDAVAVWASISKLDRYSKRQKEEWRRKGVFEVLNSRTKQIMSLSVDLLEDIEENSESSLNIE